MPHATYLATACVLNGRLHVIGGWNSNKLQVLEMTEENGLSWSCKAELPAQRDGAASVVYDGKLWVMGGYVAGEGAAASVCIYDAEADTWEAGPPLPSPCGQCTAATVDGGILLQTSGLGTFQYKNAVWAEVARGVVVGSFATCGSVLLG